MALTIEQIVAVSYPAVVAEMRKAANQWSENAALRIMEKKGVIQRENLGPTIEVPLDYRPNPDAAVLAQDQDTASLVKTEVFTAASYSVSQLNVPVSWTKGDDVKNPSENQKVSFVKGLLENGIQTHDDLIEQLIFTTSAAGGDEWNGLSDLVSAAGTGVVGGIDSGTEIWWKNYADTYTDATDIEATFTTAYNKTLKGSGSNLGASFMISGVAPHVMFEAGLQTLQRFEDATADAGYKVLKFKGLDYIFSQYGGTKVYFLNPKAYKIMVSKQYFRDKQSTEVIPGQNAFYFLIYSAGQTIVTNRSRLAVVDQA